MNRRSLISKLGAGIAALFGVGAVEASEPDPVKPTLRRIQPELPGGPFHFLVLHEWECSIHGNVGEAVMSLTLGKEPTSGTTFCLACMRDKLLASGVACADKSGRHELPHRLSN